MKYKELRGDTQIESSAEVRERVLRARDIQLERYKGESKLYANAQMPSKLIRKHCAISFPTAAILTAAMAWRQARPPAPPALISRESFCTGWMRNEGFDE